jgi:hypothetical protein
MLGREVVMKRNALSIVFCVLSASAAFAQTKSPVEGVWKVAEVVVPAGNPTAKGTAITVSSPQPGLLILTRGYYSGVAVTGPRVAAAPAKDPQNLTDAEKIARYEQWRPFVAFAGTYEIKGSTLIMRAIVAMEVEWMTRETPNIWEFKLEGSNTLRLIPTGDEAATEPRVKFTRVE